MIFDSCKALLFPFENGSLCWPQGSVLFLNGTLCEGLPENTVIQQYFKPGAQGAAQTIPDRPFSLVLLRGGKQRAETRYLIGKALSVLEKDGFIVCAAPNNEGGKSLESDLQSCGLSVQSLSKYKYRIVFARKEEQEMPQWIREGALQPVLDGAFLSQPGIFGWDKIDAGSELLAKTIPDERLSGTGADFGCGYGFLADHVLKNNKIEKIFCLDADDRAVEACRKNLEKYGIDKAECLWEDLCALPEKLPPLDWIIMNPPFHEGKKTEYDIGASFIRTAAAALKKGGSLWVVANSHLPYEEVLEKNFCSFEKRAQQNGFKVFHAGK